MLLVLWLREEERKGNQLPNRQLRGGADNFIQLPNVASQF
jgi:hypothetical protein